MTETDETSAAPQPRRDALLTSARLLVTVIMAIVVVIGVALTFAAITTPLFHDAVMVKIAPHAIEPLGGGTIAAISVFLLIMVAFMALSFVWLRELRRIIDSVGQGDAFNPINALRLARMGWIVVAIELAAVPGGALAAWLGHLFHRERIEVGLSLGGILMALVLFILARVFREGAKMREELEGTV